MVLHDATKSPNWDNYDVPDWKKYCNPRGFIVGYPYDEGFPCIGPLSGKQYELILPNGERCVAFVDFSTQYRAEGLKWKTLASTRLFAAQTTLDRTVVAAWKEIEKK